MATATLVEAGAQRLRYLVASEGSFAETVNITTTGAATPDTRTDSIGSGVIKQLSKTVDDGYKGLFTAGAQTQANARALWLSDLSGYIAALPLGSTITIQNFAMAPTAICRMTNRVAGAGVENATVDADVSAGNPRIEATLQGGGSAYLDIEVVGTIGD